MNKGDKEEIVVLPRNCVFLRFIDLPSGRQSELNAMLQLRAFRELPFSKEDMVIAYRKLATTPAGLSCFMVAMARRDIIKSYINKARPSRLLLDTELLYISLIRRGLVSPDSLDCVLRINKETAELIIISKGVIRFSRNIKQGEDAAANIRHALLFYRKEYGALPLGRIVIVSEEDIVTERYKNLLKNKFDVEIAAYKLSQDDLLDAVGLAEINLLPREFLYKRSKKRSQREILIMVILFAGISFSGGLYAQYKLYEQEKLLSLMSEKLIMLDNPISRLKEYLQYIRLIKKRSADNKVMRRIISDAYRKPVSDLSISYIGYKGDSSILYKGRTDNLDSIYKFVNFLKKEGYYSSVNIEEARKTDKDHLGFSNFSIRCRLDRQ